MHGRRYALWVGIFVVGGLALFAVGLFLIGDRRMLFESQYEIGTTFTRVTGLQVGTRVRVAGMNAGEVVRIDLPSRPSQPFVVGMRLRRDLAHLIREDSVASVQTDGIVGNAFVEVSPGSDGSPVTPEGGRIRGAEMVAFADVIAEATQTLQSFRALVDDISPQVTGTLARINETVDTVNGVVADVGGSVRKVTDATAQSMNRVQAVLDSANRIVTGVQQGQGTLGRLFTDDALYTDLRDVATRAAVATDHVRATTADIRSATDRLFRPGGPTDTLIRDVGGAATAAEELVSDLAETTEAFKRNFLVRGFFQQRGFYDIDALTPAEYRRFAGDEEERTAVRVWIGADVLFEAGPSGEEVLTAEGRTRIGLAMGTFLEYRRDGPLVVEGYATGESTPAQLLRSDARARAVRDHLVRSFRRDATITGAVGLGADAPVAPGGGGRFDGVALTLLIPK